MKRVLVVSVLVLCCLLRPGSARAQEGGIQITVIDCGSMFFSNTSHQFNQYAWLEYIVVTHRSLVLCPIWVQAEAWVVGINGSALVRTGVFAASARRQVPVPNWGKYQTNGKHWTIWLAVWMAGPESVSFAEIEPQPEPDPQFACEMQGGRWLGGGMCELPNCPIIADTARDGYRLTNVEDGVRFDLDADGVPEQVAWTRRNSDDALLALDRNGNGYIDDGRELFGNHTPAYADREDVTTANGFEALRFAEGPSYGDSLPDRRIDTRDAVYSRLLLWRDLNHNGISEPNELQPAKEAGIVAIRTDYKNARRVDRFGNEFRQRGKVEWSDGEVDDIFDVWLNWRK